MVALNLPDSSISQRDVEEAFRQAILHTGIPAPDFVIADGARHRYSTNEKASDKAGEYCLYLNTRVPFGWFKDYRAGLYQEWRPQEIYSNLSDDARNQVHIEWERLRAKRDEENEIRRNSAAKYAQDTCFASQEADKTHPYLVKKGVGAYGLHLSERGELIIPICDIHGEIRTLQSISPEGEKRFLRGGSKQGNFHIVGTPGNIICIAEGYATAASIHEITGHAVVVAFDANNLAPVSKVIRERYPTAQVWICADDDFQTTANPGLTKAQEAAHAIGALVVQPKFGIDRQAGDTDFNDMARVMGRDAVKTLFDSLSNSDGWDLPTELPNDLPAVMPFHEDLLPRSLRPWVIDVAMRMQCPVDFPAVSAIVAISSLIGARAVIQPKELDSWKVVPNLWGCIVGRPGIKKSPALKSFIGFLELLEAQESKDLEADLNQWKGDMELFEMQKANRRQAARKILSSDTDIEKARHLIKDLDEPVKPAVRRFIVNDATVEKLGEILMDNPWGVLSYRDELYGLLTGLDKQGQEGSRAFYLQGYDGDQGYTFDRIMRGTTYIPRVCIAMIGGIQPGKLQDYIRGALAGGAGDDGLLQRFGMLIWPDIDPDFEYVDEIPDNQAKHAAFEVFERLAKLMPADEQSPWVWRFTPEAQACFVDWYVNHEQSLRSSELHPAMVSHLSKYAKLIPALALIFAYIDTPENNHQVGIDEIKRAFLWSDYLQSHARRMYQAAIVPEVTGAKTLLAKIAAGKLADADGVIRESFTPSDVARKSWAGLGKTEVVKKAADLLAEYGYLRHHTIASSDPKGRGRPSEIYEINPHVFLGEKT